MRRLIVSILAITLYVADLSSPWSSQVLAQEAPSSGQQSPRVENPDSDTQSQAIDEVLSSSLKALLKLLVLAAILESALALLFNWRPFIAYFDGRGVKTLVALLASWLLVNQLHIDILSQLLAQYQPKSPPTETIFTGLITAMVIAGGSSGVNNILRNLGYRDVIKAETLRDKPPPTQAWLSVSLLKQERSVGVVQVEISQNGGPYAVAGSIHKTASRLKGLRFFIRDPGRLPSAGGISLTPGVAYSVRLAGLDAQGNTVHSQTTWSTAALSPGALVDIELLL